MARAAAISQKFASRADYRECRRLHRDYGTSFYYASRLFPRAVRRRVDAVYGFIRVADEWADGTTAWTLEERTQKLTTYRHQLLLAMDGVRSEYPTLRALADSLNEVHADVSEALIFLDSMEMDLLKSRYVDYSELKSYMRGSAVAVGLMVCEMMGGPVTEGMYAGSFAMGEAMQLTNCLRDIKDDAAMGRIYVPEEDLKRFGVLEESMLSSKITPEFRAMMRFEIERARGLYSEVDELLHHLPPYARKTARLGRVLYSRILDHIERLDYDVFSSRARTGRVEKLLMLAGVAFGRSR